MSTNFRQWAGVTGQAQQIIEDDKRAMAVERIKLQRRSQAVDRIGKEECTGKVQQRSWTGRAKLIPLKVTWRQQLQAIDTSVGIHGTKSERSSKVKTSAFCREWSIPRASAHLESAGRSKKQQQCVGRSRRKRAISDASQQQHIEIDSELAAKKKEQLIGSAQ